jgi:UDP-N-acetylglucosamine/UDP-N-acetylgalactosamine 4-epimerase
MNKSPMPKIEQVKSQLIANPRKWLVTGVAGFIGSSLLEALLKMGQTVVGLDNLSTGYKANLTDVKRMVTHEEWARFNLYEADICDLGVCRKACESVDYVLHQAALGSVPRSIEDPIVTNGSNIDGFLNMLVAARDAKVKRFVYAASSATYGDHPGMPQREDLIGRPLSPYAVTKYVNELYADVFSRTYGLETIGLRYFNVFGKRQDPNGAYAAVIPRWIDTLLQGEQAVIHGDGETSRDFCYIENVTQANLLAAVCNGTEAVNRVYNVACGESTTLTELYRLIRDCLAPHKPEIQNLDPVYGPPRTGDIRHSLADITLVKDLLGYEPACSVHQGMNECIQWYVHNRANGS